MNEDGKEQMLKFLPLNEIAVCVCLANVNI